MFQQLLKKLIKNSGGKIRMAMAIVGLTIATVLILFSTQLQDNYQQLLYNKNNQDSIANFLVINKILNNETIGNTSITTIDVNNFKQEKYIDEVSVITPSTYKASIESKSDRFPFRTDISFESVPSNFLDINTNKWRWTEDDEIVPIIAPNMFLDFYNFQFAFSQGMPQLTQDVVKMISFNINIETKQGIKTFTGRIVGFSNRITSLLVPQEFMNWGNTSSFNNAKPSRIIIKTKDAGNPALSSFLDKNGYATDTDKTRFSKYRKVVDIAVNISWITGAIMLGFAILIFTLFIQLTISSCKKEINLLVTLGTAPKQLERFLFKQFAPSNIIIVVFCLILISIAQYFTAQYLLTLNIHLPKMISIYTIGVAISLLAFLWLTNYFTIKKFVYSRT